MSKYSKDRSFTDYVHKALAIPKIYEPIGWKVKNIDSNKLENLDIKKGIDYILTNSKNNTISIQERFRDAYYKRYTDVTLRFRREFNSDPERIKSEFYKIKADYLVYGITNGKKFYDKRHTLTDFIKWAIVDLRFLRNKYRENKVEIVTYIVEKPVGLMWMS